MSSAVLLGLAAGPVVANEIHKIQDFAAVGEFPTNMKLNTELFQSYVIDEKPYEGKPYP